MLKEITLFTCIFIYCVASVIFLNHLFPSDTSLYIGTDEDSIQHRKTTYQIFYGLGWAGIAIVLMAAALETIMCSMGAEACVYYQLTPMLIFYFMWCVNTVAISMNTSFVADATKIKADQLKRIVDNKCLDDPNSGKCQQIKNDINRSSGTDIELLSSTLYDALSMVEYRGKTEGAQLEDNYWWNQNALGLHYVSGLCIIFGYLGFFNTAVMTMFNIDHADKRGQSLAEQLLYHKIKQADLETKTTTTK